MDHIARTPQQLSSVLKSLRQLRQAAQGEVASRVGLRQKTISLIEADVSRTSVGTLFRLLSALDVELVLRDKRKSNAKPEVEW